MTQPQAPPGEWSAVGKRIVQARNRAGLEQRDLAALLGMSARNLRFIEKGMTNPIPWVTAVSEATSVDGEWIEHGGLVRPGELAEAATALRSSLPLGLGHLQGEDEQPDAVRRGFPPGRFGPLFTYSHSDPSPLAE
jgi:transcriptional regulator with XRE-family HTH domain